MAAFTLLTKPVATSAVHDMVTETWAFEAICFSYTLAALASWKWPCLATTYPWPMLHKSMYSLQSIHWFWEITGYHISYEILLLWHSNMKHKNITLSESNMVWVINSKGQPRHSLLSRQHYLILTVFLKACECIQDMLYNLIGLQFTLIAKQ